MMTIVTEKPPQRLPDQGAVRPLTVAQAAEYLQVSIDTIRRWCRSGELKCTLLGDRAGYRIRQSDLDEFYERRGHAKD